MFIFTTSSLYRIALATLFLPLLLGVFAPQDSLGAKPRKNVLLFNSYENGYSWSDTIVQGVKQRFAQSPYTVDLQVEYMDSKRHASRSMQEMLLELYAYKFKHTRFDAIIASDNYAFEFLQEHGPAFFPGVPFVFCGINDLDGRDILHRELFTGVGESIDAVDTIKLAQRLRPGTRNIVVIGNNDITSQAIRNQVAKALENFKDSLDVEFWTEYSLDELRARVPGIPKDTIIYMIPFYKDAHGQFYSAEEVLDSLAEVSKVPIFSNWHFFLGHGIVGGRLLDGKQVGALAAEQVLTLFQGATPEEVPIVEEYLGEYSFDYTMLKRFSFDQDALPPGSVIINQPNRFYALDKQIFWLIMASIVVLLIISLLLILNIMQRRRMEDDLRTAEEKYHSIFENSALGIFRTTPDGHFLDTNPAMARMLGFDSPSDLVENIQSLPNELFVDPQRWETLLAANNESGETINFENRFKRRDGTVIIANLHVRVIRKSDGTLTYMEVFAEDITQRISLERQLLQSQKMEAIGTLAGGIAHDFNNILTSIINSTELALMDIDEDSMTHEDLTRVLTASQRGSRLVKQILTFSRPSQEGFVPINVSEVVHEAAGLIKASFPGNIRVGEHIVTPRIQCLADPTQIHQIVMNLCTNAFQAMRTQGGDVSLILSTEILAGTRAKVLDVSPGYYAKLTIEDNGPGMEPDIIDKIFDPFFTTKDKSEGTGLGLAVVHGIVKGHKGAIEVWSQPDEGTSFSIYLPLAEQPLTDTSTGVDRAIERGYGRIVFVEDDADQLQTIPRVLALLGYKVTPVKNARNALRIIEHQAECDLVITDFDMPEMNGLELAQKIMDTAPHLPVIMVSGRNMAIEAEATKALPNIREILPKPYNKTTLSAAICRVLGSAETADLG
ncbi:hybrid sensor histidine kinase/response regulator [Desulfoplanes sp. PS50]